MLTSSNGVQNGGLITAFTVTNLTLATTCTSPELNSSQHPALRRLPFLTHVQHPADGH